MCCFLFFAQGSSCTLLMLFFSLSPETSINSILYLTQPDISITTKVILTSCYCLLLLGGLLGNSLVIHVVRSYVRMRTTTNILIMNMAISDLLIVLMFVPSQVSSNKQHLSFSVAGRTSNPPAHLGTLRKCRN